MRRGFTLVEVLVVSAIVAVTAVVLFAAASPTMDATAQSPSILDSQVVFPEPTDYLVDTTGKLTQEQVAGLVVKLKTDDSGTNQIAVAVVPTTGSLSIEEYGIRLAEKWKVGYKGTDNGVILIVAVNDKKIRIEVGKGAEAKLTDSESGNIIRAVIGPKLHNGDWFGGISDGIDAINTQLN